MPLEPKAFKPPQDPRSSSDTYASRCLGSQDQPIGLRPRLSWDMLYQNRPTAEGEEIGCGGPSSEWKLLNNLQFIRHIGVISSRRTRGTRCWSDAVALRMGWNAGRSLSDGLATRRWFEVVAMTGGEWQSTKEPSNTPGKGTGERQA